MKIALSFWRGRIAPVLDVSRKAALIDLEAGRVADRREVILHCSGLNGYVRQLQRLDIELVVCGAISRELEKSLRLAGIKVIGFVCGDIEAIIDALIQDRIGEACFRMPGSQWPATFSVRKEPDASMAGAATRVPAVEIGKRDSRATTKTVWTGD